MDFNPYIGIPFLEKGRDRTGLDCWGLVRLFYSEQMNIDLPSYDETYSDTTDKAIPEKIPDVAETDWVLVPDGQERIGDVVLLRIYGLPWHVGLVAPPHRGHARLLHVELGANTIIEPYDGIKWKKRILGHYRHKLLLQA